LLSAVTLLLVHGFGPSLKPCAMPLASSGIAACAAGITPGTLCTATVSSLKPTQTSVGHLIANCKTLKVNGKSASELDSYLLGHIIPAVVGPANGLYITDHHHLSKAILDSNTPNATVYVCPQEDLNPYAASVDAFWKLMNSTKLMWTEDNKGRPLASWRDIPASIHAIVQDDPYRSFSGLVRDQYGYLKCDSSTVGIGPCTATSSNQPFLEFIWGDVLRHDFPLASVYTASIATQAKYFAKDMKLSLITVKNKRYSGLPNYYSGTTQPDPPVKIDKTTGCQS